jgi:hypothetical protein
MKFLYIINLLVFSNIESFFLKKHYISSKKIFTNNNKLKTINSEIQNNETFGINIFNKTNNNIQFYKFGLYIISVEHIYRFRREVFRLLIFFFFY